MSIQVKLNGEPRELPDGATMTEAVAELTAAATVSPPPSMAMSSRVARGPLTPSTTATR